MAIALEWLIKDRVILSSLSGRVTASELQVWHENLRNMIAIGHPTVHHICDTRGIERLQVDRTRFQQMILNTLKQEKFGWHIPVMSEPPTGTKFTVYVCLTREDALQFLQEHDESLEGILQQTV